MRAVVQRTCRSQVTVGDLVTGQAANGLTVLLGIKRGDTEQDADYMVDKITNLRIFEDENGKMNRSLIDTGGEMLLVSQFTLYGDARRGRRPSFSEAELPETAQLLFDYCVSRLISMGIHVETGIFGENMIVSIDNDGPCTILLDSERVF